MSLARQLLAFQLSLLAIVLVPVAAISLEQTQSDFMNGQQRRMLAVAEYSAANPLLRSMLSTAAAAGERPAALASRVESLRTTTGIDQLITTDTAGRVIASPADPRLLGSVLALHGTPNGAWSGAVKLGAVDNVVAEVPVLADNGAIVATVIAAREIPTLWELFGAAIPDLLTYLAVAGVLGGAGSWWLAARVKRQTLGLEPDQIARLVEHREAMLHGIREGVVAVDADGLITLANDSARRLLTLPDDAEGRRIDEVGLDDDAVRALRSHGGHDRDAALVNRGVLLVLNQTTILLPRSKPEVVTTLRDRTELVTLQHDLGSSLQTTGTLRAQTHEFANRLHTISMLMQLGDIEAAVDYIDAVSRDRSELDSTVLARIAEPAVAALIIAKTSLARERGAELTLSAASALPRGDDELSADLVTVLGNLIDNALDAVRAAPVRRVEVDIRLFGDAPTASHYGACVTVRDSGSGVDATIADRMFEAGVTSKSPSPDGTANGFGLAIVQLVATRRAGRVTIRSDGGTVVEVTLPTMAPTEPPVPTAFHV
ncbi:sensor histidine kinase [Lacisediminihabitans sp.]|jgi:sensor histidine kinase regulating citrate/malate metabolism|uniref:sensor histidine kinase n=1 Tax=Lacisediminihabitans sp. TaxID=2787631 RepID=UPI002F945484